MEHAESDWSGNMQTCTSPDLLPAGEVPFHRRRPARQRRAALRGRRRHVPGGWQVQSRRHGQPLMLGKAVQHSRL